MSIKNHGTWNSYVPDPWPQGYPSHVLFSQRDEDGMDWYTYNQDAANWTPGAVKITLGKLPNGTYRVHAPTRDQTTLYPQLGDLVLEVTDDVGAEDPLKTYEGKVYVDGVFADPPPPEPEPVIAISPAQGRIALFNAGLLPQAQAAVEAAGGATSIWWEYATVWERNNPILKGMGVTLGLTEAQIDDLFTAASKL